MSFIAADPEVFLINKTTKQPVPSVGLLGGTKKEPVRLADYCYLQEDNVAAELTWDKRDSSQSFTSLAMAAMSALSERVDKLDLDISTSGEVLFPSSVLDTPQSQQFGCLPDFSAYTKGEQASLVTPDLLIRDNNSLRVAGGHIHIDYPTSKLPAYAAACFADLFIGLYCVSKDLQAERRALYGQPGRYRAKSYGLEYRTLSNFWLFNESYCHQVASRALSLCSYLRRETESSIKTTFRVVPWGDVRSAISTQDADKADRILSYVNDQMRVRDYI